MLATVRSRAQGGRHAGPPAQAARLLAAAARAGARWVDVEEDVAALLCGLPAGCEVLASRHGPLPPPPNPCAKDARLAKVAAPVADAAGLARLRAWVGRAGTRTTLVPLGPLAGLRAALAPPRGGEAFLYGAPEAGRPAAPGQPPLAALLDELRAGEVGPEADLYGLLGTPPAWSPSPALHNAVFRGEGRAALYLPLPGLDLHAAAGLGFCGLGVTTPFKPAALAQAREATPEARAVGAANTLVRLSSGWRAANTDVAGLRALVEPAPPGAGAFVYGAGGYARAAVHVLKERGYRVRVAARRPLEAQRLAQAFGVAAAGAAYAPAPGDRIVLNATAAGSAGEAPEFLGGARLAGLLVLDAPYRAAGLETGLVARARADGARAVVDGRALLLAQARDQARAFGARAPDADLDLWLGWAAEPPPPLVLLGLRGAGKSTVGRRIARRAGRPFVDLDEEVERATGLAPACWIRERGWDAFRAVEAEALARALERRGVVLAPGAGAVEHAGSRAALAGRALCVWLEVAPDEAARRVVRDARDRPPWPGSTDPAAEARALLERRAPWWAALAAVRLGPDLGPDAAAAAALAAWRARHPPASPAPFPA